MEVLKRTVSLTQNDIIIQADKTIDSFPRITFESAHMLGAFNDYSDTNHRLIAAAITGGGLRDYV